MPLKGPALRCLPLHSLLKMYRVFLPKAVCLSIHGIRVTYTEVRCVAYASGTALKTLSCCSNDHVW